jgi:hypothetical protein
MMHYKNVQSSKTTLKELNEIRQILLELKNK